VNVELSEEADAQVRDIDAWWREHRRAAPDLLGVYADRYPRNSAACRHSFTATRSLWIDMLPIAPMFIVVVSPIKCSSRPATQ
jgi:hypothetical protein